MFRKASYINPPPAWQVLIPHMPGMWRAGIPTHSHATKLVSHNENHKGLEVVAFDSFQSAEWVLYMRCALV